jgi:hypothetical protein
MQKSKKNYTHDRHGAAVATLFDNKNETYCETGDSKIECVNSTYIATNEDSFYSDIGFNKAKQSKERKGVERRKKKEKKGRGIILNF